ncbi:MAG: tRNA uridine-5-carboxymethylaminomethyl(34) synthesis enzyme MnmG, partial [Candidatus Calescibacterium sp.]|nr:tRNA uridine-5-carboxymethylaminomethyl(34) synthesis enzyme MnmG [Candidatus Calescibacterium sp.]
TFPHKYPELKKVIQELGLENSYESLYSLLKRPEFSYENIKELDINRPKLDKEIQERVEIEIKYEGYLKIEKEKIDRMKKYEEMNIPENMNFFEIEHLSYEAREKLTKYKPATIAQASRIAGIRVSDISLLISALQKYKNKDKLN